MSTEKQECQPELLAEDWGARLSNTRENLSLTIEQVSSDLNLPVDYIRTLEKGSLDGLPSIVFAKGYIRAYAKLLHLDDDQLVTDFEQIHGDNGVGGGKNSIRPVSRVKEQVKANDPVMKVFSWIFILAIIGVSVWWWQTQYGVSFNSDDFSVSPLSTEGDSQKESENTAEIVPLNGGSAQLVLPKLEDVPAATETASQNSGATESEPSEAEPEPQYLSGAEIAKLQQAIDAGGNESEASEEAVLETEAIQATVSQAEPVTVGKVSADFIAECWVSIKDANGKTLFNNLRGKGQSLDVQGKAPLSILIGAADAVGRFSFNGKQMDLAEHSKKNVVRISLPLNE